MEYSGDLVIDGIIGGACADKAKWEQANAEHLRAQRARRRTAMVIWTVLHWLGAIALIAGVVLFVADFMVADNFESMVLTFLIMAIPFILTGAVGMADSKGGTISEAIGGAIAGAVAGAIGGVILLLVLAIVFWIVDIENEDAIVFFIYGILAVLSMLGGFSANFKLTKKSPSLKVPIAGAVIILGAGMALTHNYQSAFGELVAYFGKELAASAPAERVFKLNAASENGQAKIFEVRYENTGTVIRLIRATGSHKAVSIAPPGKPNSFYVKDAKSGKTWKLKETRAQDHKDASGVDLLFEPFTSREFDLIEGNDTSKNAWHFRNVKVE